MMSTNKATAWSNKTPAKVKATKTPKAPAVKKNEAPVDEPKKQQDVIGSLKGGKEVHQKLKTVRIKAMRGPVPHRNLPEDIQKWLKNKGY